MVAGGNYGWRVIEGQRCTGLDPGVCPRPGHVPPLAEYNHGGGRCAIIGGYVYRGTAGTLAAGTYTAGDFCSGEIFAFQGDRATVLLDTPHRITSFGRTSPERSTSSLEPATSSGWPPRPAPAPGSPSA